MWHAKKPSLLNGHKYRAKVKICSPSPVMTSPYQWNIGAWDENPKTNKQIKWRCHYCRLRAVKCTLLDRANYGLWTERIFRATLGVSMEFILLQKTTVINRRRITRDSCIKYWQKKIVLIFLNELKTPQVVKQNNLAKTSIDIMDR